MFDSDSSLVISHKISASDTTRSIPFILPSDPNGKFQIIWSVSDGYIGTVWIKWTDAKVGSMKTKSVDLYVVTPNYSALNPLPMVGWQGSSFPGSTTGYLRPTHSVGNWTSVRSARVFIEFNDISGVKVIPDPIPIVPTKYIEIHSNQSPISNDVRIYFPATKSDLWTTESSLSKLSDHFSTLLSSDYSEGAILTEIRNDESTYEKDFEDSDDDEDESQKGIVESNKILVKAREPFKQIKIDAIAHSTVRAFLHWIQTSQITFAPLSSNYRLKTEPNASRRAAIDKLIKDSTLPRPVSPKSIYRLAHYYNIPTLKELAITSIKSQLSVTNAAFEVFGDLSQKYEEIRDICIDYSVKHWNKVSQSKAMEEVERLVEAGEIEISLISLKISKKLKFVDSLTK